MGKLNSINAQRRIFLIQTANSILGSTLLYSAACDGRKEVTDNRNAQQAQSTLVSGRLNQEHPRGTGGVRPLPQELANSRSLAPVDLGGRTIDPGRVLSVGNLPSVHDQGIRGTCVAFAFTTLNEHVQRRRGNNVDLSQQHLYYECKQIDGLGCDDGTYMRIAADRLANIGQCTFATCSYQTGQCQNELGNVLPDTARREASAYRLHTTEINPNDTEGMKAILQRGWPVAILMDTYKGWDAEDVWRTGEMTMPPSNEYDVAHAVCLIAFTENPVQPFPSGYFLFRNSWGPQFGRECTLGRESFAGQGDGKMPIEYIRSYCLNAYTPSDALART